MVDFLCNLCGNKMNCEPYPDEMFDEAERREKAKKKLIRKLKNAKVTCMDCGLKYGRYSVGMTYWYEGRCDVCGNTMTIDHKRLVVTDVKDYDYLKKGILELGEQ